MDASGGVVPAVCVEISNGDPVTLPVNKVFINEGPGFIIFLSLGEISDFEDLGLIAPARRAGRRSTESISWNQQLNNSVIKTLLKGNEGTGCRAVEAEPLGRRAADNPGQVGPF